MKHYIQIITSLCLWANSAPIVYAQTAAPPANPAAAVPAQPAEAAYPAAASPAPSSGTMGNVSSYAADSWAMSPAPQREFFAWTGEAREGEAPASVITFKAPEQTTVDETAEDLNILSLIFSKNLERALGEEDGETEGYKLGIPMLLQNGGRWVEASYIEGFGAVFNLKVRFPLVPAPIPDKDVQSSPGNSEWEQARRALAGNPQADLPRGTRYEKARRFSPKLVETLKRRAIELLRNASNLRHVQPDEWVAVAFAGPPNVLPPPAREAGRPGPDVFFGEPEAPAEASQPSPNASEIEKSWTDDKAKYAAGTAPSASLTGAGANNEPRHSHAAAPQVHGRVTIMTIRIKKRDADAFAAHKLSEDQFVHAAEVTSYLGPVVVNGAANDYLRLHAPR